ncbi:glycosyltransferase N-terminal domain-containing protein [uncultured Ilyobacter sp.]|uniref:3-deoxy-D-manno-octulosonic acid transferase n=1 Tax=uncultured Ilyobacter sp. TaxID=544433 RepID=UPI0029C90E19|nr:glycosyltransferase N-terminal domain-containing protein [uncultured Ilyobacter sp.]
MFYNLSRIIIYIPLFIISVFCGKLRRFLKKRLFQKMTIKNQEKDYVWIHCASVGEINLSESLVREFLANTDLRVLITMVTDTGRATAEDKYKENKNVDLLYFPLDDLFQIRKILSKINLKALIIVETEIWPNLIEEASKKAKVVFVNGRISDKSFKSYKRISIYLKKLFSEVDLFLMQTEEDRERIINIGAPFEKVDKFGNLKFDVKLTDFTEEQLTEIRKKLGLENKKILVAGSTRNDEEEYVLDAYDKIGDYFLILVPRHIERVSDIEDRLLKNRYNYEKWNSMVQGVKKDTKVLLVDQMGVLRELYAICDVAFVGGTLVNIGGHSLIEPLYYRKPPIFGKYLQNVKEISKEIIQRKIGFKVDTTQEFIQAVQSIEAKQVNLNEIDRFFLDNKDVAAKTFKRIIDII